MINPHAILRIRVYCSLCGKMLVESEPQTRKQIEQHWNDTVIAACFARCSECGTKVPNFKIDLKIVNTVTTREYTPEQFLKLPKKKRIDDMEAYLDDLAKKVVRQNPEQYIEFLHATNGTNSTDNPESVSAHPQLGETTPA